ncbi:MAG: hypothetical protein RIQ54_414 [Candidatus Parcubacteria bacterium]
MTTVFCRNITPSQKMMPPLPNADYLFSLESSGDLWHFDFRRLDIFLDIGEVFRQTCSPVLYLENGLPDLRLSYSFVSPSVLVKPTYSELADSFSRPLPDMVVASFVPFVFLEALLSRRDCFSNLDHFSQLREAPSVFFIRDNGGDIHGVVVQSSGRKTWSVSLRSLSASCPDRFCLFLPVNR